jgi:hypothetical protein
MEMVGQPAREITGFDVLSVNGFDSADHPNAVMVADFWAWFLQPTEQYFADIRRLHRTFREAIAAGDLVMVGVNRDTRRHRSKAADLLEHEGLDRAPDYWPHVREGQEYDCPLTYEAYRVKEFPWTVVIDRGPDRRIRYVGTPEEPLLYYAIRAALRSDAEAVPPADAPPQPYVPEDESVTASSYTAKNLLDEAENAYKEGDFDQAKKYLDQLIREHPQSREVFTARRFLELLDTKTH